MYDKYSSKGYEDIQSELRIIGIHEIVNKKNECLQ
jgi:hypothetical protein